MGTTKVLAFKTRKQQQAAKKRGQIDGYFGKVTAGRPAGKKTVPKISLDGDLPMNKKKNAVIKSAKKTSYVNWAVPENFNLLRYYVLAHLKKAEASDDDNENSALTITNGAFPALIPRTTLNRHALRFQAIAKEKKIPIEHLTMQMIFPKSRGGGEGLLQDADVELLSNTIIYRDEANNGMSRNEAISLVMELSQTTNRTAAEGHYDYLVRKDRLKGVKNSGRTVKAQATTSKRGQITVEQQLRWHTTAQEALDFQRRVNKPTNKYLELEDHFFGNLDETCLMANADGTVRVIGSASKKKTEKNTDDSRASITSLRIGLASGAQGPFTFLAKGVRVDRKSISTLLKEQCPKGSQVIMSPSAYMTDDTWLKLVPGFAKGIRELEVVKDHPDWWLTLTCDGFSSHTIDTANEIFAQHKIAIIKEEGDASQVNQSYDQQVAKKDKSFMRMKIHCSNRGAAKVLQYEASNRKHTSNLNK